MLVFESSCLLQQWNVLRRCQYSLCALWPSRHETAYQWREQNFICYQTATYMKCAAFFSSMLATQSSAFLFAGHKSLTIGVTFITPRNLLDANANLHLLWHVEYRYRDAHPEILVDASAKLQVLQLVACSCSSCIPEIMADAYAEQTRIIQCTEYSKFSYMTVGYEEPARFHYRCYRLTFSFRSPLFSCVPCPSFSKLFLYKPI